MNATPPRTSARTLVLPVALVALGLAGCSSLPFGLGDAPEPALRVVSQPKGDGGTARMASFTLGEPGYVVVRADANGRPGQVIGRTELLEAGAYQNVEVQIDPSRAGERVHPMLHVDDGDGTFEFPGDDGPALVAGQPLSAPIDWR